MWSALLGALFTTLAGNAAADKTAAAQSQAQQQSQAQAQAQINYLINLQGANAGAYNKLSDIFRTPHFSTGATGSANSPLFSVGGSANGVSDTRPLEGKNPNAPIDSVAQDIGLTKRNPSLYNGLVRGDLSGALDPMGLVSQEKGDNWTSLWSQPTTGMDYARFVKENPDIFAGANGWSKPDVQKLFNGDEDSYIDWWKKTFDPNNERKLYTVAESQQANAGNTGAGATGTTGTDANGIGKFDMNEFWGSPYGQLATSGFRGVDVPSVNGSFAAGGKLLSGAQKIALDDRGRARAEGEFGNYVNGLSGLAGLSLNQTAPITSAVTGFGATAQNGIINQGNINALNTQTKNNNWQDLFKNIGGQVYGATGAKSGSGGGTSANGLTNAGNLGSTPYADTAFY